MMGGWLIGLGLTYKLRDVGNADWKVRK